MLPELIGFTGPKGSGKTTYAAHYLIEKQGYHRASFADPLKQMLFSLGCTKEQLYGEDKEKPNPIFGGKTNREVMQTLGTDWGRDIVWNNIWIDAWERLVTEEEAPLYIVADDLRFPNEAEVLRRLGGIVILVSRDDFGNDPHTSEQEYKKIKADYVLENRGTREELEAALRHILEHHGL